MRVNEEAYKKALEIEKEKNKFDICIRNYICPNCGSVINEEPDFKIYKGYSGIMTMVKCKNCNFHFNKTEYNFYDRYYKVDV